MTASSPDAAARDMYARLLEAWNTRNAEGYAALFADDGALIGFDGSQASGPQILDHLRPIFEDHPTAAYVAKVREVRRLAPAASCCAPSSAWSRPASATSTPRSTRCRPSSPSTRRTVGGSCSSRTPPAQYHGRPDLAEQHTAELRQLLAGDTTVA